MDLDLAGKVAVVTGGTRGIGRSVAMRLADEGCNVAICARSAEPLEIALNDLNARGVRTFAATTDVCQEGGASSFISSAIDSLGGVDLLVANAGGNMGAGFLEASLEEWKRTFDLNLFHAVEAARAAAPSMRDRGGGSIVMVASISGWKPVARRAQYAAAKAAEIQLARSLALELAPHRIRVNSLSPGSVLVEGGVWDGFRKADPEAFARFEREECPWGRLATPEEIADVVVFLLSNRARWINGANIQVDGAQHRPSAW